MREHQAAAGRPFAAPYRSAVGRPRRLAAAGADGPYRRRRRSARRGPVVRPRAYDAQHNTALTDTLDAWLSTFGDVIAAFAAVHIHPNTFRYRLKRLAVVAGIDLHDPEAGFEAMPQLRLRPPDS
ncbi:helix-turn-helix domain-containing protein [Streptomyces atratus]|uniref:helix-turn-helix domain-containing protein n=1 Tax=Streptomyces atratus TaxID=1893 RepID=UPI0033E3E6A7